MEPVTDHSDLQYDPFCEEIAPDFGDGLMDQAAG
jgi:hypothetical protein